MITCFFNNVYLCFLPAHTSHGLQPLDNGVFNASKATYRKELAKLSTLTDSTPVDKINFIRCYAKARKEGMTKKTIQSAWRVTGNWPINRNKALVHPEVQQEKEKTPEVSLLSDPLTPSTSRHLHRLSNPNAGNLKRTFRKISKAFEDKEMELVLKDQKIQQLEAMLELKAPKKRKKIPNPNKRFMQLSNILGSGQSLEQSDLVILEEIGTELGDDEEEEEEEADEAKESPDPTPIYTCSGCQI